MIFAMFVFIYDSRWDSYSPCGRQIEGTPFVAFKVPLAEVRKIKLLKKSIFTRYGGSLQQSIPIKIEINS
jgi:hypothetical protein